MRDSASVAFQRDFGTIAFEPGEQGSENQPSLNMVAEPVVRDNGFDENKERANHRDVENGIQDGACETSRRRRPRRGPNTSSNGEAPTPGFKSQHGSPNRGAHFEKGIEENEQRDNKFDEGVHEKRGFEGEGLGRLRQEGTIRNPFPSNPVE